MNRKAIGTAVFANSTSAGGEPRTSFCASGTRQARRYLWTGLGRRFRIHSRTGGETKQAHLFVAVLGASSYTYAEATSDEQMINWLTAHMRAFEFFGGLTKLIVPDNTRTGVARACRYDPDLNPTYHQMAMHYGVGVVPARAV